MTQRTATFSLTPAVKRDWLEALRSGNYNQSRDALYDPQNKSFCCLGVLCEVAGVPRNKMQNRAMPQDVGVGNDVTPDQSEMPTNSSYFAEEFAWSVRYDGKLTPLSVLNDINGLSFNEIADIVEKQVPTHRT